MHFLPTEDQRSGRVLAGHIVSVTSVAELLNAKPGAAFYDFFFLISFSNFRSKICFAIKES